MTPEPAPGRVVTFYSYKGGTGRTMAMANVAWILATNGYRVLTIDWDLEAPGLHRFFGPLLPDREQRSTEGLIDALMDYVVAATRPRDAGTDEAGPPWYDAYTNLLRFAQPIGLDLAKGRLDMIGAGRQGSDYAARVNTFDWRSFYDKFAGRAFLDAAMTTLRSRYDYILIDSRTGVSDTSGICTVHLPDALVVCFTLNNQSIEGASAIAHDAVRQRGGGLPVYPVPTRVEYAEFDRLQAGRALTRTRFGELVTRLDTPRENYLDGVEVKYVPYYAYEEQLAAVVEAEGTPTILRAYERLAQHVSRGRVESLGRLPTAQVKSLRTAFRRDGAPDAEPAEPVKIAPLKYDVFISHSRGGNQIAGLLRKELEPLTKTFLAANDIRAGDTFESTIKDAIVASRVVLAVLTP